MMKKSTNWKEFISELFGRFMITFMAAILFILALATGGLNFIFERTPVNFEKIAEDLGRSGMEDFFKDFE